MLGLYATADNANWKMWFCLEIWIMKKRIATAHHATPAVLLRYQRRLAFIFNKARRAVIGSGLDVFIDSAAIWEMAKFWTEPKICSNR